MEATWLDLLVREVAERPRETDPTELPAQRPAQSNVVSLPQFEPLTYRPSEFFAAVQEWEGTVTAVHEEFFTADLYDVQSGQKEPSELGIISYDDIDPEDRDRVVEGAIFRWLIGHSRTRSGKSSRKWVIYFRRVSKRASAPSSFDSVRIPPQFREPIQVEGAA
jgi:hypothetical protein